MVELVNKAAQSVCAGPFGRKIAEKIGVSDDVSTLVLATCKPK
jgi:hypothetical protein